MVLDPKIERAMEIESNISLDQHNSARKMSFVAFINLKNKDPLLTE